MGWERRQKTRACTLGALTGHIGSSNLALRKDAKAKATVHDGDCITTRPKELESLLGTHGCILCIVLERWKACLLLRKQTCVRCIGVVAFVHVQRRDATNLCQTCALAEGT